MRSEYALCRIFSKLEGWDTFYLGANMPTSGIIDTLVERHADILALSATMTFHCERLQRSSKRSVLLRPVATSRSSLAGIRSTLRPACGELSGADAYAPAAGQAVSIANQFVEAA